MDLIAHLPKVISPDYWLLQIIGTKNLVLTYLYTTLPNKGSGQPMMREQKNL